ncbi:Uncharacterised protein [uncultured archaeon]|nr:Uncharacterised protein [uncultured archaeon]
MFLSLLHGRFSMKPSAVNQKTKVIGIIDSVSSLVKDLVRPEEFSIRFPMPKKLGTMDLPQKSMVMPGTVARLQTSYTFILVQTTLNTSAMGTGSGFQPHSTGLICIRKLWMSLMQRTGYMTNQASS